MAVNRPFRTHAQQAARRPRIGVLIYSTPDQDPNTRAFLEGLRQLGYADGQNVAIEYHFAQGRPERLPELAAELARSKPDVIFALGGDVTPHVAKATQTIPIIYAMSADPVLLGLAASLARPGGNSTAVTFLSDQLAAKRLETFREVAPRLSRVGVVRDPSHADNEMPIAQRAAQALKLELQPVEIRDLPISTARLQTRGKPMSMAFTSCRRDRQSRTRNASSSLPTGNACHWWVDGAHGFKRGD